MSDSPALLLEAVGELARLAGERALAHFGRALAVEAKGDGSPVTVADRETEQFARAWIAERFPGDEVVGEEFGATGDARAARRWLIDPIDGTISFVRGVPLWGTLLAVVEGDTVLAGAAAIPACGELVAAAKGEGAWWNGTRCRVSACASVAEATVLATGTGFRERLDRHQRWDAFARSAKVSRTWGDAFGYVMVATGRAEVMMDARLNDWDAAPVQILIEEAGGEFRDWRGERTWRGDGAIATNAALAAATRAALADPRA